MEFLKFLQNNAYYATTFIAVQHYVLVRLFACRHSFWHVFSLIWDFLIIWYYI